MAISQFPIPDTGGIPSGNTASRPGSPAIGDTYYNGQLEILEIFNGTSFVALSATPATPSIATPTDSSNGDAFTTTGGKLSTVFTPNTVGGLASQYNALTTADGHSAFSSTTTVTISGLTPGTAYIVTGNVQNAFGVSGNSGNSASVTPTTKPQSPTIGTASVTNASTNVTVTWILRNTGGKALSAITITPFLNGVTAETAQTAATTASTTHTFTGLTMGSAYTFKVKTTNANGDSPDSSATDSVTIPVVVSVDYLVIAGGGGGGGAVGTTQSSAGGGGAGGYRSTVTSSGGTPGTVESVLTVPISTNITVTVGAGGAGGGGNDNGTNGVNSVFSTITSTGGGGGGGRTVSGLIGGSGGGGGGSGGGGGTFTANQGFAGGGGANESYPGAGAGGGAAGLGGSAQGGNDGDGGIGGLGAACSITGSSVTRAGGGAGGTTGARQTNVTGGGGVGGGGNNSNLNAGSGTANTGGGGGGGARNSYSVASGAGGSGVVILRYLTAAGTITVGAGLTGTTDTDGSHKVTTITAGTGNVSWA